MLNNTDFKNIFQNYKATPPASVWENIAYQLEQDKPAVIGFWQFNSAQKMTLVAASLISIFLSAFVFNSISQPTTYAENTTILEPEIKNNQVEKTEIAKPTLIAKLEVKPRGKSVKNSSQINTIPKVKLELTEELKPFKKEILELAAIDLEIEKLAKAINKVELNTVKEPELIYTNNEVQTKELIQNLSIYNSNIEEEKPEIKNVNSKPIFLSKLYITPTFGANYTKISYSNASNSPYFTYNAEFGGKVGYNAGFQLGYQFNTRWSIESGISFGQYLQTFKEQLNNRTVEREGIMYIDQLDFPLLARYSIPFGNKSNPRTISFKAGLMYNSVVQYQVNYLEKDLVITSSPYVQKRIDADKRNYNSLQLGYAAGVDFDSYITKKISINFSVLNSYVSQLENFPTFTNDTKRPRQFSTSFSIGTKIRL
jgi:Outer membrane protein beta-barrel domain